MADDKKTQESAHRERVELSIESKIPSRSKVAGIWHVINLVDHLQNRITQLNRMTVAPMAAATMQAAAIERQAAAQAKLNAAMERSARIQGNISRVKTVTSAKQQNPDGSPMTIVDSTRSYGPGRRVTEQRINNVLEKTTEVVDFDKAEAAEKAKADRRQKFIQRRLERQRQEAEEERKVEENRRKMFQSDVRSGTATAQARYYSDLDREAKRREAEALKEERRREGVRRTQAKTLQELQRQFQTETNAAAIERQIADLRNQGFRRVSAMERANARAGTTTLRENFERIRNGRIERVTASRTRDQSGRVTAASGAVSDAPMSERLGRNFLGNLSHVTAWATGVFTLYGALGLARNAMTSLLDVGGQTQRLSQVFRGVGGSAAQLTNDVLGLAAANGRGSEEAMASAIAWSRLGFNRIQVNEAVRVSLMAANVAEVTAAEATERLSAIMSTYNLRVGELGGVLGMVNATSNTWNVTNKDLFDGISKVASVAKQAGIPLAELIGLIGAGVGTTGQTGANIGNALKSVIGSIANVDNQKFLRQQFGIEITKDGGDDVKNMSQVLSELFISYQRLTDAERQHLVFTVAGKNQASRMTAMLDSYVRAQVLAINAQLHLNSAEEENAKIKAGLRSQLTALNTEWIRFVNNQGKGPAGAIGGVATGFKNALTLANTPSGSILSTAFLGLMTAMAARLVVTAFSMKVAAQSGGFFLNSINAIRSAMGGVNMAMQTTIQQFAATRLAAGGVGGAVAQGAMQMLVYSRAANIAAIRSGGLALGLRIAAVSARAAAVAMVSLVQSIGPILAITAAISAFNWVMSRSAAASEAADRKLAGFSDEAEAAAKAADAAAQAQRLFDTVGKALPNARPQDRMKMLDEAASVAFIDDKGKADDTKNKALAAQLKAMVAMGDITGAQTRLEEVKNGMAIRSMLLRGRELEILEAQKTAIKEEIALIQAKNQKSGETEERRTRLADKEKQLAEVSNRKVQRTVEFANDTNSDLQAKMDSDVRHLALMEREKLLAQSIADIYHDMAGVTESGKFDAELQSLNAQLAHKKQLLEAMNNDPAVARKAQTERDAGAATIRADIAQAMAERTRIQQAISDLEKKTGFDSGDVATKFREVDIARNFPAEIGAPGVFSGGGAVLGGLRSAARAGNIGMIGSDDAAEMFEQVKRMEALTTLILKLKDDLMKTAGASLGDTVAGQVNKAEIQQLESERDKLEAQIKARDNSVRRLAEQRDRNQVTTRFGKNEGAGLATGDGEGEIIANQQKGLEGLIEKRTKLAEQAASEAERQQQALLAMQAINDLEELHIRKRETLVRLEVERTNLIKEQAREFQRSLLLSSPGDLLRKLAVKQIGDSQGGKIGLGAFMALDERGRRDAQDAFPNLNPRIQDINRSIEKLGPKTSLDQDQDQFGRLREARGKVLPMIKPTVQGGLPDFFGVAMRELTDQITGFKTALFTVVGSMEAAAKRIDTVMPQPKTVGIWHPTDDSVV